MTTLIIDNDDKQTLEKYIKMGQEEFNLKIHIANDTQKNNLKIIEIEKEKKGKWAKVADEIKGTMSESTSKYLQKCSKEIRSGFELRDLTTS